MNQESLAFLLLRQWVSKIKLDWTLKIANLQDALKAFGKHEFTVVTFSKTISGFFM